MRVCGVCGTENRDEARFCEQCGSPLGVFCDNCGAELPSAVRFCPACGAPAVQPPRPGEERKLVTVLFADVAGSTGLGARMEPERLREVMDAYFDAMRREVEAEGGTVEKFIGDAVMAVFGVPTAHEDDPTRALRAGLRMRRRLADLNRNLEEAHGVTLAMRIGVNSGEVSAVTPPRPGVGMVTGDTVNVAARLEQYAASGQILASERTVRATRGFGLVDVGPLELRGKDEVVRAFEVHDAEPGREPKTRGRVPMIGRQSEIELLETIYRRSVSEGRPNLVTIYGEAGVGKSRLVEEFETWAQGLEESPSAVRGRCLPYGDGVTYWALAEILKRYADVLDSDPPDLALGKIREAATKLVSGGLSPDPERAAAALAFSVGLKDPASPLGDLEPRQVRLEAASAWRSFFSALARPGPAIVVLEDLHWADSAMLDLVEELAERVEGAVLLLCSARQELAARRPGWGGGSWNFSSVLLQPLGVEDAERLLDMLLAAEETDLPRGVRTRILGRAGGNPFFLEEIVHHLIEERPGVGAEGGRLGPDLDQVEIPDTVQAVLAARIDLLQPLEKRVLQSAAVVGREFWSGPVARLLQGDLQGRGEGPVQDALSKLQGRGLVLTRLSSTLGGEREYVFRHVLTRDVAYESLPYRERGTAHAQVATWIEEVAHERGREFAELLAHHYAMAYRVLREDPRHDPEELDRLRAKAFQYALLASEEARSKLALDGAERQADLALSLAASSMERSRTLEALGRAAFLHSDGDRAWQCLKEAVDLQLAAQPPDPKEIARLCARALEVPTRGRGAMRSRLPREEAAPYLEAGMANAGQGDSEELARLLIVKAFWPASLGEGRGTEQEEREARESGEQAADMAMRLGRPDLASAALDGAGQYYLGRGLYGQWRRLIERRLELAGSLADPIELGDIYAMAAWCSYHIGWYRQAEGYADKGVEATLAAAPSWALFCLDWRAVARCRLGEWDAVLEDVSLIGDLLGDRKGQPPGYVSDHLGAAAFVHEARGDPGGADRLLEVIGWLESEEERPSAGLAVWKALLLARRGRFEEAHAALELPETLWHGYARGSVLEARCEVLAGQGAWEQARGVVAEARRHANEAELLALPWYADRLEGLAALARGHVGQAVDSLARALAGFKALEAGWEAARSALALAEALTGSGSTGPARQALAEALPTLERLRSVHELARAQELAGRLG